MQIKWNRILSAVVLPVLLTTPILAAEPSDGRERELVPADWLPRWSDPPAADRPMQIVHGIAPGRATPEAMRFYKDRGLGGVVCNVGFDQYLTSEENWKTLATAVESCRELGMVVWLYDEEGYPSGAAGGVVLKENPALEATELALDASRDEPFIVRPAYEHTHASNNFHAARRYPNLIDDRATRCFLDKTHEAYWRRLEPHFGRTIEAIFTDEPSLIAIDLGQLPEDVRRRVRVVDPIDPAVRPLPCVPWGYDLAEQYRQRWGEDLIERRGSLFGGDSDADRQVRRRFWALIADLVADRYFGQIGRWCAEHRLASCGHSLWEEQLMHHVALEGNGLKVLAQMDIPGLDMLSSDPQVVGHTGWMTAAMPASAAILGGRRRVMTEVSDFSQKLGNQGPVGLAEMQATAAWQAAWGVTDFTLYYGVGDRSADDYRAYGDCVGRLNAVLKPARPAPDVLLYYPIYDLWAEYLPVAGPLGMASQSPRARRIVGSFMRLGQLLQRSQIPFTLIDHEHLAAATAREDGTLAVADQGRYKTVVLPDGVKLPEPAAAVVERFRRYRGRIVAEGDSAPQADAAPQLTGPALIETLRPACRIAPASPWIVLGRFLRDGRTILLVANVASEAYQGHLATDAGPGWLSLDPASGEIRPAETDPDGRILLALQPRQAVLLVQSP
ncbi:MAG: hypothetical protein JXB62_01715 [Pirellulales bacterium]|nr:hypothetical protein [Pirellulales bacterium]